MTIDKTELLQRIIAQLAHDLELLFSAAKAAHEASISEENIPDNKYDTLALEASYVAQGQANRAQKIRQSLETYKQLPPLSDGDVVRLTSLVTIEADGGARKTLFIGPLEGGLKIRFQETEIMVITPASPLGRELIGKAVGDTVEVGDGSSRIEYEVVAVC
jgi:transcription elongation GreA/GreB family factor